MSGQIFLGISRRTLIAVFMVNCDSIFVFRIVIGDFVEVGSGYIPETKRNIDK